MALTQLKTSGIADDAVTTDKLANAINTERTANTAKVSLGADSVTGAKIADDAVGAEHIETLDGNVQFADSAELRLGTGSDLQLYHDATNSHIKNDTNALIIRSDALRCNNNGNTETMIKADADGAVELYHDNSLRTATIADGFKVSHSDDSGATTLKLENNSTHNSQNPKVKIAVDLASGKDGGSIEFIRGNNYQSSAAADSEIVISPTKNDTNQEAVRITQDWFRLHSNCSGIQFNSDTASANALNDYEEGTWTPSIAYHYGSVTSYGTRVGKYTKIGNMVYADFYIALTDRGDPSGSYSYITGMPYNHSGSTAGAGTIYYFNNFNYDVSYLAYELGGSSPTVAWLTGVVGTQASATSYLSGGYFTNTSSIVGQFVYRVSG